MKKLVGKLHEEAGKFQGENIGIKKQRIGTGHIYSLRSGLKTKGNARLFHNSIGKMPGFYLAVHRKTLIGKRTKPDVMVALAMPLIITSVFRLFPANLLFIFRQFYATTLWHSIEK